MDYLFELNFLRSKQYSVLKHFYVFSIFIKENF